MRKLLLSAGLAMCVALAGSNARAGDCDCGAADCTDEACTTCDDNACGGCGLFKHHGGLFGHHGCGCGLFGKHCRNRIEGRDPWFNCGCNGSYKFPVPPLYTYHWPGMNSHNLMTDYHSPWRFPPLKPYTDEPEMGANASGRPALLQVNAVSPLRQAKPVRGVEPVSSRMDRYFQ